MSNSHGTKSKLDLRINLFQQGENDTRVSLCALIYNFMHLTQVFQVEKDLKIAWKISYHVTSDLSNNETSNLRANKDFMQDITWDVSQDISWDARNIVTWGTRNLFAWKVRNLNLAFLIVFNVACVA